jgi:hypothetical protein
MQWTVKASIQRALTTLPGGSTMYYTGQRLFGGFRSFTIKPTVQRGLEFLQHFKKLDETLVNKRTLEVGTGWSPVLPLLYWLFGHEVCHTYDITRLLKPALVTESAKQLVNLFSALAGQLGSSQPLPERLAALEALVTRQAGVKELLGSARIHYYAPANAS